MNKNSVSVAAFGLAFLIQWQFQMYLKNLEKLTIMIDSKIFSQTTKPHQNELQGLKKYKLPSDRGDLFLSIHPTSFLSLPITI